MRIDFSALGLRLLVAWFLLAVVLLALFLVGSAQSFLESVLIDLFRGLKTLSWAGAAVGLVAAFLVGRRPKRVLAALGLALGFSLVFGFSLLWGSWIYPNLGGLPW